MAKKCEEEEERLQELEALDAVFNDTLEYDIDKEFDPVAKDTLERSVKVADPAPQKKRRKGEKSSKPTGCFFCRSVDHLKKDCSRYHEWRAKKGTIPLLKQFNFVYFLNFGY